MIPLDIDRIRRAFPARTIDYHESIDSTMTAATGRPIGHIVIAEEQTAGQGRHGHSWHSDAGDGIYCSHGAAAIAAPHPCPGARHSQRHLRSHRPGLRSPLAQRPDARRPQSGRHSGPTVDRNAIAGIGINVNQDAFPRRTGDRSPLLSGSSPAAASIAKRFCWRSCPQSKTIVALDRPAILHLFTASRATPPAAAWRCSSPMASSKAPRPD